MKIKPPRFKVPTVPKVFLGAFPGQILLGLGPLLLIAAFSAAAVSGKWTGVPLGLGIASGVILSLGLWVWGRGNQGFWGRRSTQVGTNAFLSTLAVLVILTLINFMAVRYSQRYDLTEKQFLSLAPQSQAVVAGLKQPLKVLIFESPANPTTRSLLDQYQRQGKGKFSYEFIDPQAEPGLVQKYQVKAPGDAFLESGKKVEPLTGGVTEVNLTPAIQRLLSDRQSIAYFTLGHGEFPLEGAKDSLSQAIAALEQKNITPQPLNLLTRGRVPADASLVILAGPKKPFLTAEVLMLQNYLQMGGSLLLMLDPGSEANLEPMLKSWGVEVDRRLVVDISPAGQMNGLGPAVALVYQYGDHPITRNFGQEFSFFPLASRVTAKPVGSDQITELLITSPESWAESNPQSPELKFDPATDDLKGPLSLGVAISRNLPIAGKPAQQSRMVVIGDSEFAVNGPFEQGLNGDLFLNAVTWLSDRDDQSLSIRPKEATNRRLQMTSNRNNWLGLISLLFLPFGALTVAALLWWKRR
jgi:ABC-type uncharacterized transport system involved in gliding motility auxiliary subunit